MPIARRGMREARRMLLSRNGGGVHLSSRSRWIVTKPTNRSSRCAI